MTPKQAAFVQYFLADGERNATAAYRKAYPRCKSENAAAVEGARLLRNPKIISAITEADAARSAALDVTAERIIRELARIGFADPASLFNEAGCLLQIRKMPESIRRAISSIKVKRTPGAESREPEETVEVRFWSKTDSLEKLGKNLGMFADRLDLSGGVNLEITEEIIDAPGDPQDGPADNPPPPPAG